MTDFVINDSETDVDSDEEVFLYSTWINIIRKKIYKYFYIYLFFQLQEAFAKGFIKPGLTEEVKKAIYEDYVNNVADLRAKLREIELRVPWIEKLDVVTSVAPMAPDVALQIQETAQRRK